MASRYTALVISIPDSKGIPKLYCMIPVDMPPGQRCWDLKRKAGKNATKTHRVTRDANGRYACSCQDFEYNHGVKRCKHIRALVAAEQMTPLTQEDKDEILKQRGQGRNGAPDEGKPAREAGATAEAPIPD